MNKIMSDIVKNYDELVRIAGYYTPNKYEAYELVHYSLDYVLFELNSISKDKIITGDYVIPYFVKVMQGFSKNSKYTNLMTRKSSMTEAEYDLTNSNIKYEEYNDEISIIQDEKRQELKSIVEKTLNILVEEGSMSIWKKYLFTAYYFNGNMDKLIEKYRLTDVIVNRTRAEIEEIVIKRIKYGK